jgi:hypothetical protein
MRITNTIVALVLIVLFGMPSMLLAQRSGGSAPATGILGPRVLGQPQKPKGSTLVPGVLTQTNGSFLGTTNNMLASPWRVPVQPLTVYGNVTYDYYTPTVTEAKPMQIPQVQPDQFQTFQSNTSTQNTAAATGEEAATGETAQTAPAAVRGASKYVTRESSATTANPASLRISTSLSSRITQIVRSHGIETPTGITVSLGNGAAVINGVVGNSNDRAIVANLVGLEPGVWRVDNQLSVSAER